MRERGIRKRLTGIVIGDKMDKTAMVLVNRLQKNKTYMKYVRSQSKYMVHDPRNMCRIGDRVKIVESRAVSKRKRWQVIEIVERAVSGELENDSAHSPEHKK